MHLPPPKQLQDHKNSLSQTQIDRVFLSLAVGISRNSDDPKARIVPTSGVGAVIANSHLQYVASANVIPPPLRHKVSLADASDPRRYTHIEHAERAALFTAHASEFKVAGATMYCTRFPCSDCARAIVFSGICRFVVPKGFSGETGWVGSQRAALDILRVGGVTVRYLALGANDFT